MNPQTAVITDAQWKKIWESVDTERQKPERVAAREKAKQEIAKGEVTIFSFEEYIAKFLPKAAAEGVKDKESYYEWLKKQP